MGSQSSRARPESGVRIGVDVGGTFTDLVALVDGRVITAKVPSTPDQSDGVAAAIAAAGLEPGSVAAFAHGTTVATNALLERRGARIALVTTEGFRDVVEIGRQNRPSLYDLGRDRPEPLVPRRLRFTVRERTGPEGVVSALDEGSVRAAIESVRAAGVDAVAVCLLFGYLHPAHERAVAGALRDALGDVHLSLSSEVLPEFREYERCATTCADAYLAPRTASYLANLGRRAAAAGLPEPLIMQSSGGVLPAPEAAQRPAALVLSGPAGGVLGAAHVAAAAGFGDVLTLDMGGTSTDVAPIVGGAAGTTTEAVIGGVPVRLPAVDVHTIGAGGGSVAWIDDGGALRVGPRSAGARPGPASYGLGGGEATVTDADLVLGYLADGARLGGEIELRRDLAEVALARLGDAAGLTAEDAALGVARVAEAEMGRALRVISVERGLDPRSFALVAFGGAGPMHACALAEQLGIATVVVPLAGGVLSALGLALADVRRDYVRPLFGDLEAVDPARAFAAMEAQAEAGLPGATTTRGADVRYRGQSFELTVPAADWAEVGSLFHAAHRRRYGYAMESEGVELVCVRLTATLHRPRPEAVAPFPQPAPSGSRPACFDGRWVEAAIVGRPALASGDRVAGPAIVEFAEATCVVRPGWGGRVDAAGSLVLGRT